MSSTVILPLHPSPWLRGLASALALVLLADLPVQAAPRAEDPAVAVEHLLAAPLEEGTRADELASRLAACGPGATRALLDALSGRGGAGAALGGLRREAALEALASFPRSRVVTELAGAARAEASEAERSAALEVLGAVGETMDVALLLRLGAPAEADGPRHPEVERAFEGALATLLERRPESLGSVASQMRQAHPSLLVPLVRQAGRCRVDDRLEVLASQLPRVRGAEGLLLVEIEALAPRTPLEVVRRSRAVVREQLDSPDPLVCLAACRAVAALQDPESVEALIELLGAQEAAVREAALGALESVTRQVLGTEAAPWSAWYRSQLDWWRGDAQRHLQVVRLGVRRELAGALMGLAPGYLFRDEIAPVLTPLLRHDEPDVARLTASILASLGTRAALPALADALTHADPAVAGGAHKALRRITGRDLGAEPSPWLELPH